MFWSRDLPYMVVIHKIDGTVNRTNVTKNRNGGS